MKLLGYHVNNLQGGIHEHIAKYKPPVVVAINGGPSWVWAFNNSPNTKFLWRGEGPTEPYIDFNFPIDPVAEARKYAQWSLDRMAGVKWDYVLGVNEPVIHTRDAMSRLARFEVERSRILHDNGYHAAVGSFSVGNPGDMSMLSEFMPAIYAIHQYRGVLSLHEYGYPQNLTLDAEWYILRHRKFYNGEPSQGWAGLPDGYRMTPLIITETGGDKLIYSPHPGGYKEFLTDEEYILQLEWLDRELQKDKYVIGSAIYCLSDLSYKWHSYDLWYDTAQKVGPAMQPEYRTPVYGPIDPPEKEWVEGIDVSYWQLSQDWRAIRASGKEFAIVRSSFRLSEDSKFEMHYNGARNAGLVVGMYHYLYHDAPGYKQGVLFGNLANKWRPQIDPVVDVEQTGLTDLMVADFFKGFYSVCNRRLMVYTSKSKWNNIVGTSNNFVTDEKLWVADWGGLDRPRLPAAWVDWEFWQYTSMGEVPGYSGRIDTNRFRSSETELLALYGSVDIEC